MEKGQITLEDINFGIVVTSEKKQKNKRKEKTNSKSNKKSISKSKIEKQEIKIDNATEKKEDNNEVISIHSLPVIKSKVDIQNKKVETTGMSIIQSIAEVNKIRKEEKNSKETPYIKKENVMTRAEAKLYDLIESLLGERVIVLAKIRMADVVEVEGGCKPYDKKFRDIAMKHLDYIILDRKSKDLICTVELDDHTHDSCAVSKSDIFKTQVLNDCDIPLFRTRKKIDTITFEDLRQLEKVVNNYYAPKCPVCGRDMEERESYVRGKISLFYGCKGFPKHCRNTVPIK